MRYFAQKTETVNPSISSPEWDKAQACDVVDTHWDGCGESPKTTFKMLHGPEGVSVLMNSKEKNLRTEVTEINGEVCSDSCMEFFFKPSNLHTGYFNFEVNPKGVYHLGFGDGRHGRIFPEIAPEQLCIETDARDGDWSFKVYVPYSLIDRYVGEHSRIWKCNFYKCGDLTVTEHYGAWCLPETAKPDFHVPDFFGFVELS